MKVLVASIFSTDKHGVYIVVIDYNLHGPHGYEPSKFLRHVSDRRICWDACFNQTLQETGTAGKSGTECGGKKG